jgi:hypothetical protein
MHKVVLLSAPLFAASLKPSSKSNNMWCMVKQLVFQKHSRVALCTTAILPQHTIACVGSVLAPYSWQATALSTIGHRGCLIHVFCCAVPCLAGLLCSATSWLMYAVGVVAAAQVFGVDIGPLIAVGELRTHSDQHVFELVTAPAALPLTHASDFASYHDYTVE